MTHTQCLRAIRQLGLTVRCEDGEYRVNYRFGVEATAYYTDDREDAVQTAKRMAESRPRS